MKFAVEHFRPMPVVYTRRTGDYQEMAPVAWQALWKWVRQRGLAGWVRRMIGAGLDDPDATPPAELRYDACLQLDGEPAGDAEQNIGVQTIPGGSYAVYRLEGSYRQMRPSFQALQHEWIPAAGLEVDPDRPFLEIYLNDPDEVAESDLLTDLCIPVQV